MTTDSLASRVKLFTLWGFLFGIGLSLYVTVLFLVKGATPSNQLGETWLHAVAIYLTTGPASGFLLGVLQPLTGGFFRNVFVGSVAALPFATACILTIEPLQDMGAGGVVIMSVYVGVLGSFVTAVPIRLRR